MLSKLKIEGKDREEILTNYLNSNNLTIDDIWITETIQEAKLFKSKKIVLDIVKKDDIKDFIKEFIGMLSKSMNFNINIEIREIDNGFNVLLISDNNPILIGKEGKNLNAIQLLMHQAINCQVGLKVRVNVDCAGYKDKRFKRIEKEVRVLVKEVLDSKISVKLDPMNSYERRLVHTIVADFDNLISESFGEGTSRYVMISYKED